ncbi:hypothetical protein GCM10011519_33070 [Marmoricola endophyticus]|uniref:ComF family protein n=1 Tax=Marmoricola endophyticus TaxID=2040280 RepID=A0A917BT70_9ACTN|nr:ComF family protein [Marmoricola endophyticus]GGF56507.1 hypothetical protein GCM10011519_33070 [Marmoricola endophyticus]
MPAQTAAPATVVDALLDLVTGSACAVCGRPGRVLCRLCRAALPRVPLRTEPEPCPPGLAPACVAGAYAEALRSLVLAHKEHGVVALARPLGDLLATAADGLLPDDRAPVLLVPVPSRASVVRARGHDPVLRMTRRAARVLAARGHPVGVRRLLRQVRRPRDQAGLDADARRRNLLGSTRSLAAPVARVLATRPQPLLLVCDDVLTTGWTARESQRALEVAGLRVDGIACVAATRRRHRARALVR